MHGADSEFVLVGEGAIELHLEAFVLEEGRAPLSSATCRTDTNNGEANVQLLWVMTPVSTEK
jgi:hypothetical protein